MDFDWWTFTFQLINVVVMLWILSRFLFRPVAQIIADRQAQVAQILQDAEMAKVAAANAEASALEEKEKIASERFAILEAAQAQARDQKDALMKSAREQAAQVSVQANEVARKTALEARTVELREATQMAIAITEKLLANLPEDSRVAGYDRRLANTLANLDDERREAIVANADGLELVSPRPLTDTERDAILDTVRSTVGRDIPVTLVVDTALIAGLELRSAHGVVHNSLSADLARIAKALEVE